MNCEGCGKGSCQGCSGALPDNGGSELIGLRPSRQEDVPRLRALWKEVFGDGEDFLDLFFSTLYVPADLLVLTEEGRIVTMLCLLPMAFAGEKGERLFLPYVYALATDPAVRGKGYARQLLHYTDWLARSRGAAGLCTVPAESSLHRFFASAGYEEGLYARRRTVPREAFTREKLQSLEAEEYNRLRREALAGKAYVDCPDRLIAFQKAVSRLSGGELYRTAEGCAAVELAEDLAFIKEELPGTGDEQPLGMWKWFSAPPAQRAYFGLAFD